MAEQRTAEITKRRADFNTTSSWSRVLPRALSTREVVLAQVPGALLACGSGAVENRRQYDDAEHLSALTLSR